VSSPDPQDSSAPPSRAQFGLRALLIIMVPIAVLGTVLGGLLGTGTISKATAIILGTAAPVGLMILFSLAGLVRQHRGRKQ